MPVLVPVRDAVEDQCSPLLGSIPKMPKAFRVRQPATHVSKIFALNPLPSGIVLLRTMPRSPEQDEVVIRQVLTGDVDAFAEIIEKYQHVVWKVVVAMLLD